MKRFRRKLAGGFTLLEALFASVILAMTVAAIILPFTLGARNEKIDARKLLAVSLAQEMMEEILSRGFYDDDPNSALNAGPDVGETDRIMFDNADDYDGYVETSGNIVDAGGGPILDGEMQGLSRLATVDYVYLSGQDTSESPTFACISVEVAYRGQTLVDLKRLIYATPEG